MRFAIFFLVLLTALSGLNAFVYKRLRDLWGLETRGRRIVVGVLLYGLVAMVLGRTIGRYWPSPVAVALGTSGAAIQLAAIVAFAVLAVERLAARLIGLGHRLWGTLRSRPTAPESSASIATETVAADIVESPVAPAIDDAAEGMGRREMMGRALGVAAVGLGAAPAGYGALFGRHDYAIEEVPVRLAELPPALDGFTIVQLSDVHLGLFVGEPELKSMMEMVRRAKPDAIVLTGDLIDNDPRYVDMLGSMARRLGEQAPVYAIPGNHDYYAGIGATTNALRKAGATVMVNEATRIAEGKVALLGVDDVWAKRYGRGGGPDVLKAAAKLPREVPRVLLCHNPVYFPEASPHIDLQLSGHTHGGQYNPGGLRPADLVLPYGYVAGRYERDGAQLWVNRGFGTAGPPARVGAPPEITKVVLTG